MLEEKFNIPPKGFDGEHFHFHSTLFQDKNICEEHEIFISKLNERLYFPFEIFDNRNLFIYKQVKNYTCFWNMYNFFDFLYIFIEQLSWHFIYILLIICIWNVGGVVWIIMKRL